MLRALFSPRLLVMTLIIALLAATAVFAAYETERRAIVSIRVAGDLRYTPRAELEKAVAERATSSLYQVDVASVRGAAVEQAWVKHASVRRVWPDSLHIAVIEREPVARWRDDGLIEADASVFYPPSLANFERLPMLAGPDGTEQLVLDRYRQVSQLLATVSRRVIEVSVDERHAWRVRLDNDIELLLGQNGDDEALKRLVRVFHAVLEAEPNQLERVDLRYTNGFAVLWKATPPTQEGGTQG